MTVTKALVIAVCGVLSWRCAPSIKTPEVAQVKLPEAYETAPQQPSIKPIAWKDYFQDQQLVELITRAMDHNLDLRVALQRIEVARAGVRHATGAQFPQVDLAVGAGIQKFGLYTIDGAGNDETEISLELIRFSGQI